MALSVFFSSISPLIGKGAWVKVCGPEIQQLEILILSLLISLLETLFSRVVGER